MNFDPKHLAVLHVIQERGGLTAAAGILGTSQPALSRLVTNMEVRLGAPLFDRSSRPWRMTLLGQSLAAQGGAIQTALNNANDAISHFRNGIDGNIRLGGTPYLCEAVLPSMITNFQQQLPGVTIDQSYAYTAQLLRRLQRREIDLVVAPVDSSDILQGLTGRRLLAAKNIIACREKHPLTKQDSVAMTDLLNYRWVAPPQDSPLAVDMRDILNELNAHNFNTAFSGGALATVAQLLEESDCLAILPAYVLQKLKSRYTLTTANISLTTPTRSIMMVSNADEVHSQVQSAFFDYLEGAFHDLSDELKNG